MKMTEYCVRCLYDKQKRITDDEAYLEDVKRILENRAENDTAPMMVYLFDEAYERHFGKKRSYREIKKKYNDLVLSYEESLKKKIEGSERPIETALAYSRIGNYIDFGALNDVDEMTFLSLFEDAKIEDKDRAVVDSFLKQIKEAKTFLFICDNCGEIVLDKLFLEELKRSYPDLNIKILVRGAETLNDATLEDAEYVGMDKIAGIIGNGMPIAGTIYELLPDDAKNAIDTADVILAKGQANYESLCKQGRHIFYSFLCKCDLFTSRFNVPELSGVFIEETK